MELNFKPPIRFVIACIVVLSLVHTVYQGVTSYLWYYTDYWFEFNEERDDSYGYLMGALLVYLSLSLLPRKGVTYDRFMFAHMLLPFSLVYALIKRCGYLKGFVFFVALFLILSMPIICELVFYLTYRE